MNEETKEFVEKLIIKHAGTLPANEKDWLALIKYNAAPYIMQELCEALNIYGDEE